jgi:hypothetical protein
MRADHPFFIISTAVDSLVSSMVLQPNYRVNVNAEKERLN